jgi:predicted S18 family serine protease
MTTVHDLEGLGSMNKKSIFAALCLCILFSTASAGCVSFNPLAAQPTSPLPGAATINPPVTGSGTAHMVAVRQLNSRQSEGAVSDVFVSTEPGSGHVFVETAPLVGVDFQDTARIAVNVAAYRAHIDSLQQDFQFVVRAPADVIEVDGPSAGLPMAIAAYSALTKQSTNSTVYATGAIDNKGNVGTVGGVYWKALAAAQSGARVIIVPQSETVVTVSSPLAASSIGGVDLQSQLRKDGYDVKVIGVTSVDQALPYYFS